MRKEGLGMIRIPLNSNGFNLRIQEKREVQKYEENQLLH